MFVKKTLLQYLLDKKNPLLLEIRETILQTKEGLCTSGQMELYKPMYSWWTLELHIFLDSPVETDVVESLSSAWKTTHQYTYNIPNTLIFLHTFKHKHFFGVTCRCFRPWGRSDKCITDLLKYHFVFFAVFRFAQVNKSYACRKYKVMFSQIPSAFARPALGSEKSTCHSKKKGLFWWCEWKQMSGGCCRYISELSSKH